MRLTASILMFFGILLIWTSVAHAGSGSLIPQDAYNQVIGLGGALLASGAAYLFHRLVGAFEKRTGIDVPEREEKLVNDWIEEGRALAEEKAHVLIKLGKAAHPPEKKQEIAVNYALDRVTKAGLLEKFPRDVVSQKSDARVQKARATK